MGRLLVSPFERDRMQGEVLLALDITFAWQLDSREAPLLSSQVPYLGNLLSMARHGSEFWAHVRRRAQPSAPMVTLHLGFGERMYVITQTTPRLVDAFLAARTLRLAPKLPGFMKTWAPLTPAAQRDYPVFFKRWLRVVPETMTGEAAETFHRLAMREVLGHLDDVRHACEAEVYGGFLGYDEPQLTLGSKEYEKYMIHYAVSPAPSFTAPSGCRAREYLISVLHDWVLELERNPKSSSRLCSLAKTIFELPESNGWSTHDKAAMTLIMIRASLSNEGPILFWLVGHIFADSQMLARLRVEGDAFLQSDRGARDDGLPLDMSLKTIEAACPLLVACCKENQRLTTVGPLVRTVLRDTTLHDGEREYLLRKGSIAVLPTTLLHVSEDRWGPAAQDFDPGRFVGDRAFEVPTNSFFPFGHGRDECPGQYLATNVLLWVILLLIVHVDIEAPDGASFKVPDRDPTPLAYLIWSLPQCSGRYMIRMRI
ncbi:cytochrome P450 [Microdochium bolleyi]|uniref:Cytochrome P450 n=1 Tax=Microdochium bolleyi TaxID=196109 RepID=A0A136JGH5_9PEZI|nr:cytochrome P450 [Microdochium bolleyi]